MTRTCRAARRLPGLARPGPGELGGWFDAESFIVTAFFGLSGLPAVDIDGNRSITGINSGLSLAAYPYRRRQP